MDRVFSYLVLVGEHCAVVNPDDEKPRFGGRTAPSVPAVDKTRRPFQLYASEPKNIFRYEQL